MERGIIIDKAEKPCRFVLFFYFSLHLRVEK